MEYLVFFYAVNTCFLTLGQELQVLICNMVIGSFVHCKSFSKIVAAMKVVLAFRNLSRQIGDPGL